MLRYSILFHDHPAPHWDLFLDPDGLALLWSWRLPAPPDSPLAVELPPDAKLPRAAKFPAKIAAARQPDHRRLYLDYEGPVSGNRGTVTLWDRGEYELLPGSETQAPLACLHIRCRGARLTGKILLNQSHGTDWTLEYRPSNPEPDIPVSNEPNPDLTC